MAKDSDKKMEIKKILVAVDHSSGSEITLNTAAMLAKIIRANVHGIYVQEEHWENINQMPSVTFVNELTGKTEPVEENQLARQVNRAAKRLQRRLKKISRQYEVSHSWQNIRGPVIEEILKAGKEADLITIGRRGGTVLGKKKMGSTTQAVIKRSKKPVLVLAEKQIFTQVITVVYDATEESKRGLQLGLSIAESTKSSLFILAVNNRGSKSNKRNRKLEKTIADADIPIKVATLNHTGIGNFIHLVKRKRPGLIIISKNQPLLKDGSTKTLLHYLRCAVLLMQ